MVAEYKRPDNATFPETESFADYPLRTARIEYLAVEADEPLIQFLNRRATEGWKLVAVDNGVHYFEREDYCIYQDDENGNLTRRRLGENA